MIHPPPIPIEWAFITPLQIAAARAASIVVPFFSRVSRPMVEQRALSTATAARAYFPITDEPFTWYVSWLEPHISTSVSGNPALRQQRTLSSPSTRRAILRFVKPKTRPMITPDTTRTDTAARAMVTVRRLNETSRESIDTQRPIDGARERDKGEVQNDSAPSSSKDSCFLVE